MGLRLCSWQGLHLRDWAETQGCLCGGHRPESQWETQILCLPKKPLSENIHVNRFLQWWCVLILEVRWRRKAERVAPNWMANETHVPLFPSQCPLGRGHGGRAVEGGSGGGYRTWHFLFSCGIAHVIESQLQSNSERRAFTGFYKVQNDK